MFLYNATAKTGYLLSDLNDDNVFETGVVLKGASAATAFGFGDILLAL